MLHLNKVSTKPVAAHGVDTVWQCLTLQDIADVTGGIAKDTKKQDSNDEEVPYLRVANVQRGFLDLREIKKIGRAHV